MLECLGSKEILSLVHIGPSHKHIGIIHPFVKFILIVKGLILSRLISFFYLWFGGN